MNQTIMRRVARYLSHVRSKRFVHKLGEFERAYNQTYHTTIKMKPLEVSEENAPQVWKNIYERKLKKQSYFQTTKRLNVGDLVLLPKKKGHFDKGYSQSFGEEVFKIKQVKETAPVTYAIEKLNGQEIVGSFYNQELVKVPETFRERE